MVQLPVFPQELNLSYQDLGDPFQSENFLRILRRLIRAEKLQLVSNSLTDLSSVHLPRLESHYPECTIARHIVTVQRSSPYFILLEPKHQNKERLDASVSTPVGTIFLVNWPVFLAPTLCAGRYPLFLV